MRRDELEPAARVSLFAELAEYFKSVVAFPSETVEAMPDEQYIRNVVDILFRSRGAEAKPVAKELAGGGTVGVKKNASHSELAKNH